MNVFSWGVGWCYCLKEESKGRNLFDGRRGIMNLVLNIYNLKGMWNVWVEVVGYMSLEKRGF